MHVCIFGLATSVGLVIYAFFAQLQCDPIRMKYISNSNQVCGTQGACMVLIHGDCMVHKVFVWYPKCLYGTHGVCSIYGTQGVCIWHPRCLYMTHAVCIYVTQSVCKVPKVLVWYPRCLYMVPNVFYATQLSQVCMARKGICFTEIFGRLFEFIYDLIKPISQ